MANTQPCLLSDCTDRRENNFDFLRFTAASLVLFSHCYAITGREAQEPFALLSGFTTFGGMAVMVFFVISGFLITKSWHTQPNLLLFFKKRCLRLLPALAVSVVFCVTIVGALMTSLTLSDYLLHAQTRQYFMNILVFPVQFALPGVFMDTPQGSTVNGSLWTLPIEVTMYAVIAILGMVKILRKNIVIILLVILIGLQIHINQNSTFHNAIIFYMKFEQMLYFAPYFIMGSLIYILRDRIYLKGFYALMLLTLFIISFRSPYINLVSIFALPYIAIYFAYSCIPYLKSFGRYGDFSYGMYIFAFPIQQTLVGISGNTMSIQELTVTSFAFTFIVAAISWRYVEQPVLTSK